MANNRAKLTTTDIFTLLSCDKEGSLAAADEAPGSACSAAPSWMYVCCGGGKKRWEERGDTHTHTHTQLAAVIFKQKGLGSCVEMKMAMVKSIPFFQQLLLFLMLFFFFASFLAAGWIQSIMKWLKKAERERRALAQNQPQRILLRKQQRKRLGFGLCIETCQQRSHPLVLVVNIGLGFSCSR